MRDTNVFGMIIACAMLGGCASFVSNATSGLASNLSTAILNHDDPETARAGMPSYMLLMDSFVEGSPNDPAMLGAAADLYAAYGAVFADDPLRASRLTRRARGYAEAAMCNAYSEACNWDELAYEDFESSLAGVSESQAKTLYTYGFSLLAYIRTHSSDFNALAELPQAEAILTRYLDLAGEQAAPAAHSYLGILKTLRPPALGGKPEEARSHFEKAIKLTEGKDLSAKVEFAKGYARTMYDRELHDRLIAEVLDADPYADGYTLMNVMAQDEARRLAAEADDYF
jgi:hypothetical protein